MIYVIAVETLVGHGSVFRALNKTFLWEWLASKATKPTTVYVLLLSIRQVFLKISFRREQDI